jgi:hypothetical protein
MARMPAAWMRLLPCFSWSFYAVKTPRYKNGMDAIFVPTTSVGVSLNDTSKNRWLPPLRRHVTAVGNGI